MARSFEDYIDDYNRKAYGAGSDKDPATDRFSGLDVRKMFDAGTDKYDLSKREAAEMVLDYADDIEGKSKMGGGTRAALEKLERHLKEKDDKKDDYKPVTDPEDDPEYVPPASLVEAQEEFDRSILSLPENQAPRMDTRYTDDPSKDAISAGDDLNDWYGNKFEPHLQAEANLGAEQMGEDTGYFLDKFVYGPPELGGIGDIFEKYRDEIDKAA